MLMHESGEWMEFDPLFLPMDKMTAQGAGSVITYARRYALSCVFGIASESDDDGNHASVPTPSGQADSKPNHPPGHKQASKSQIKMIFAMSKEEADTRGEKTSDVTNELKTLFHFKKAASMTADQASKCIKQLQDWKSQKGGENDEWLARNQTT